MNSVLVSHLIFLIPPKPPLLTRPLSVFCPTTSVPFRFHRLKIFSFSFFYFSSLSLSLKHSHITHRYTLTKTTIEADATVVSNHCLIYLFSQKTRKIKKKNKMYSIKEKVTEKLSRLFADSPNNSVSSPYDDPQVLVFFFFLNQFSDLFVYFTYYVF